MGNYQLYFLSNRRGKTTLAFSFAAINIAYEVITHT